jgi:hypothetical protein
MIKLKDLENFVKKFPELELIHKKDYYGKTHHYCVLKESQDFEVFEYHNPTIFLNQNIPLRVDSEECKIYRIKDENPYGHEYYNFNEIENSLKQVVFMLNNLLLLKKKMKMYEKKLDLENDFKE